MSIVKAFDYDWASVNAAGHWNGFVDPKGNPIYIPVWSDSTGVALLRPDGTVSDISGSIFWDNVTVYPAGTLANQVSLLSTFAHTVAGDGTGDQITISSDISGNLTLLLPQGINLTSDPTFRELSLHRLLGSGNAPTIQSTGTGAGSSGTPTSIAVAATSTDLFCVVTMTPSAAPATAQTVFNVNFASNLVGDPLEVLIFPLNAAARAVPTAQVTIGSHSNAGFNVSSNPTTALTAATVYKWGFMPIGTS
jgi:hypothetical protein